MVKNLPCNAKDASSSPGLETKIPHAAGQPSLPAATAEPACCYEDPAQQKQNKTLVILLYQMFSWVLSWRSMSFLRFNQLYVGNCSWVWDGKDFPGGVNGKEPNSQYRRHEMWVQSLGWDDPLEEGMATHSHILAWRTPWTEEPGGLRSVGSQRVGHDWSNLACMHPNTK